MTNGTDASELTRPKTICVGTTPAATHLARLADLVQYLKAEGDRQLRVATKPARTLTMPVDLSDLDRWAESVQWLIADRS